MPVQTEAVLKTWRNGSVIRSKLVELMHEQYAEERTTSTRFRRFVRGRGRGQLARRRCAAQRDTDPGDLGGR